MTHLHTPRATPARGGRGAQRNRRRTIAIAAVAFAAAATALVARRTLASDHQDTPEVELSPRMDINDVYAFPGASSDRIVLVLDTSSPITPGQSATAAFDPNLLYQLKVDNTGDGIEDRVFQITFGGSGTNQTVSVRGPVRPNETGTLNTLVTAGPVVTGSINTVLGTSTGTQVFAGIRDDPFFLDLEQFFRIVPDRKPVTGPLSQLPGTPSASSFRPAGQAVDYLRGVNTLAVVIELPMAQLTTGGTSKIGVWGSVSR